MIRKVSQKGNRAVFVIRRPACCVCGEPPFGDEYCCGHEQPRCGGCDSVMENTLYRLCDACYAAEEQELRDAETKYWEDRKAEAE